MTKLSKTEEGIEWISQLHEDDQSLGCKLLDTVTLVGQDEFVSNLRQQIINNSNNINGKVALFAERELKRGKNKVYKLYKEPKRKKNRRAEGMGPQPVQPKINYDLKVGSEGLIAWLISDICRDNNKFISHPSPNQIRNKKIRKFVLVTDIIGSGDRVLEYLESAWSVASIKSWKSLKYLSFVVIAYSGTELGIKRVKHHKTCPTINIIKPCPTIDTEFDKKTAIQIKSLCINYDPVDKNQIDSLGHRGSGVLLAFAHGCPNNAPRILHKLKKNNWKPIFPKRVTTATRHIFGEKDNPNELKKRLERLHETRLANGHWLTQVTKEGQKIILLLAALRRGPRFSNAIARKTGLTIPEIEILLEQTKNWGWVSEKLYLTESGKTQLSHIRKITSSNVDTNDKNKVLYFPKSLRAPQNASS